MELLDILVELAGVFKVLRVAEDFVLEEPFHVDIALIALLRVPVNEADVRYRILLALRAKKFLFGRGAPYVAACGAGAVGTVIRATYAPFGTSAA
jgi:hypothetical protein